jgi:hypothetical protein
LSRIATYYLEHIILLSRLFVFKNIIGYDFIFVTAACIASARCGTVFELKPAMLILLK